MARDRGGTTFDEAKSFIDRLMDSGDSTPAAQSAATFNILDVQANRGTKQSCLVELGIIPAYLRE